ncbi:RNA polymerase sigma factor [Cyclobacterium marinum]|uniref:RNA polymerase, sigma-24 subunit, ECF subfamily n=1 Tax=Cyclobacterium marinum (strain ATCC 25205 / DSM 745 / LMG 13164 / NCIMB 1802) TaxID=880070 RepID=G0J2Y2_CYCMS|nr:sigma-70 family RNA polymerase sigma factor [Cyclobacterium marinum]AEL27469.1 RNA polymerase, sigma-24 subunit, ECF subfamily [Cyclobacterium marinum DSM 745]
MIESKKYIETLDRSKEDRYWELIMEGDKSGLEGMFSLYAYELMAYGLKINADRELVKDCIQDLFIDLWKYRENNRKVDHVKNYIFKVLSNKIRKEIKARVKRREVEQLMHPDGLESQMPGPESNIEFTEEKSNSKLQSALKLLPLRQRQVVIYVFLENIPHKQIAKIMGINVQSVYTLTWKAINNLRKLMVFLLFFLLAK